MRQDQLWSNQPWGLRRLPFARVAACACGLATWFAPQAFAQSSSQHALRFAGTPAGGDDRVLIPIDDNAPSGASQPCDLGNGSFSLDFWVRGWIGDNTAPSGGGDREFADARWRDSNVVIDRDLAGSQRRWGISFAGGLVRFGTGKEDAGGQDATEHTLEGNVNVLDGLWHHVCVTRDAPTGRKTIYVDGQRDVASAANASRDDVSFPDSGVAGASPTIIIGGARSGTLAFKGTVDEVRFWNASLSHSRLLDVLNRVQPSGTNNLVGAFRLEDGQGTTLADASGSGQAQAQVLIGPAGPQWLARTESTLNTAVVGSGDIEPGFTRTTAASNFFLATSLCALPDGRILVGEKDGTVHVYQNGQVLATPMLQLNCPFDGERGLLGMCVDPAFQTNKHIYIYYTTTEPRNRVSRFTITGNFATSEFVVWQNSQTAQLVHHGGGIDFGADGKLYIATGDQLTSENAQTLSNQHAKLLRVNPDGSAPADNPFANTPGAELIYALGLRNPFRIAGDAPSGRVYVGDVGGNSFLSWEEVQVAQSGVNYGWPNQEGADCYVSGAICAAYTLPWFKYQHWNPRYYDTSFQASITLGPVYRGGAFGAMYRGNLFVGDYANGWVRRIVLDASGNVAGDPLFIATGKAPSIVDLDVGADGSLYYVTVGVDNNGTPIPGGSALYRLAYTPYSNEPPVAVSSADRLSGPAPLQVSFASAGTIDPDNGPAPLAHQWSMGDGTTLTGPSVSHTFSQQGVYDVVLTVTDGASSVSAAPLRVRVGNAPNVIVSSPANALEYVAGQSVPLLASATDAEDGALPASAFRWDVTLVHLDHSHPYAVFSATNSANFVVPNSGHTPENTHYEVRLTVTDSTGLSTLVTRQIDPRLRPLTLATSPVDIPMFVDGEPTPTPREFQTLVGFVHAITAQATYVDEQNNTWDFVSWSNAGPREQAFIVPDAPAALVAQYQRRGGLCADLDFNNDGVFPDLQDLIDFLEVFASAPCPTPDPPGCDSIDFNLDGVFPDLGDVAQFIDAFAGAC
jgi:glucose/arabinose dehydrogenase